MAAESEIVAKKIESGEYFSEGITWFHSKFTRPRTEFAYYLIICAIAVTAFIISLATMAEVFPLSPGKNFILGRHIGATEHLTIQGIQEKGDTANDAIIKYMLNEYVIAHEEYIEDRLDRNFRLVAKFSSDTVFNNFLEETSPTNPNNPVIYYGKKATIDVSVDKIKLVDAFGKPAHNDKVKRAIVNYTTVLTFLSDNTQNITSHQADITFKYRQINVNQDTGKISQHPEIQITDYKTNNLK